MRTASTATLTTRICFNIGIGINILIIPEVVIEYECKFGRDSAIATAEQIEVEVNGIIIIAEDAITFIVILFSIIRAVLIGYDFDFINKELSIRDSATIIIIILINGNCIIPTVLKGNQYVALETITTVE